MKLKKVMAVLMAAMMILMLAACQSNSSNNGQGNNGQAEDNQNTVSENENENTSEPAEDPAENTPATDLTTLTVGQEDVKFGNYTWKVLDVQDGKALLLTEDIIEFRPYHKSCTEITWADSDIRSYLNSDFITNNFSEEEQQKIIETAVTTPDNEWFNVEGGEDTQDKVFLLSIEEVVKYFGDSGQLENGNPDSEYFIDDEYNEGRIAYNEGVAEWWFLRSPGGEAGRAADMSDVGTIILYGDCTNAGHGTRPALCVSMQ